MISLMKLIKMAKKWHKVALKGKKAISFTKLGKNNDQVVTAKGHFVIYSNDQRRYVLPISYLNNYVFKELLKMSEEEFGISNSGPLTLPCDSSFVDYIVSLIQGGVANSGLGKALISSVDPFLQGHLTHQQPPAICGY